MEQRGEGWVLFAGIMLGLGGSRRSLMPSGPPYDGALPSNLEAAIFGHSLVTYGWIDVIVAAILLISAVAVVAGSNLARWIGITAAAIAGISAIYWMPFYPVWAFVYMLLRSSLSTPWRSTAVHTRRYEV